MRVQTTESEVGLEWNILELACLGVVKDKDKRLTALLGTETVHLGELIEQSIRHNLLPLVAHAVEGCSPPAHLSGQVRGFLRSHLNLNRHRNRILTRESLRVVDRLRTLGITVACTKGVVFQFMLYEEPATRTMFDVDMMIHPQDRDRVAKAMIELGYVVGEYDWTARSIVDLPRHKAIMYRLSPDHLPHHLRLTQDPLVPYVSIDFANSLTWTKSPWHIPMEEVLAKTTSVPTVDTREIAHSELPTLLLPYSFLFTVLHLFREAWLQRTSRRTKLVQFCDIARFWHREREVLQRRLPAIIKRHNLAKPLAWVCGHTDALFGTRIAEELAIRGEASDRWLHSARGIDGSDLLWAGSMRDRLRDRRDIQLWTSERA